MFLRTRLVWFYLLSLLSSSIYPSAHLIVREEHYKDHYKQPMSCKLQISRQEKVLITKEEKSSRLIAIQTHSTDVNSAQKPILEPVITFIQEQFAALQRIEHEAREKNRQEALLEKYGHKYQTSPELSAKLQAAQQAQSQPDTRSIFEKIFYTRPEVLEERAVRSQIFQERSSWRQQSVIQAEQQEKDSLMQSISVAPASGNYQPSGMFYHPIGLNNQQKDKFRVQMQSYARPGRGIKMAEFREILGLDKEKKSKEEQKQERRDQSIQDLKTKEKIGAEKEAKLAYQRAVVAAASQELLNRAAQDPKSVKSKTVEKAKTIIDNAKSRALNDEKSHLLPVGPGGYQGTLTKNRVRPRDESGAFIDKHDHRISWDETSKDWHVKDKHGKTIKHIKPYPDKTTPQQHQETPPQNNILEQPSQDQPAQDQQVQDQSKPERTPQNQLDLDKPERSPANQPNLDKNDLRKPDPFDHDKEEEEFLKLLQDAQEESDDESSLDNNTQAIQQLADQYSDIIDRYRQQDSQSQTQPQEKKSQEYINRLETRLKALLDSQENNQTYEHYTMSPQAQGFMMANNMNTQSFASGYKTSIQHCLTHELITMIEQCAVMRALGKHSVTIDRFVTHQSNLIFAAQQLNQESNLQQAIAATDMSHLFSLYGRYVLQNESMGQAMFEVTAGVYDGTAQSLQAWYSFLQNAYHDPRKTMQEMVQQCNDLGSALMNLAQTMQEFAPEAYKDDLQKDLNNYLASKPCHHLTDRAEQNYQTAQQGIAESAHAAQAIIQTMMEQSLRKNVADATKIGVDTVITGKIAESIGQLSALLGSELIQAGKAIEEIIPPHFMQNQFNVVTSAGQVAFVIDTTGENIITAAAAAKTPLSETAQKFARSAGQAAGGARSGKDAYGNHGGGDNHKKSTGAPSDAYTYPNGKYENAGYHTPKGNSIKSPAPRDGQKALDNSFEVKGSKERVAIEDGKIVILKHTMGDIYHGYVVDSIFDIKNDSTLDALVKHGFINNKKSRKIIKK